MARSYTKQALKDTPRIYVGTYAKYNGGSIQGEWLDLDDYSDWDDFMEAARELHSDEEDPELMFQDWEGIPDWAISESHLDKRIFDLMDATEDWDDEREEAFKVWLDNEHSMSDKDDVSDLVESFEEAYEGSFRSMEDFAYDLIEQLGGVDQIDNKDFYFDKDSFVRDLGYDGWNEVDEDEAEENPDEYPEGAGVYNNGEFEGNISLSEMVDNWMDEGIIGGETISRYFDYESFAHDLQVGGDYSFIDGHVFRNM